MARQRRTQTYALYDGNKKVYIGTTDNLERREQEHRDAGKRFYSYQAYIASND